MYNSIANPMPDGKLRHFPYVEAECAPVLACPVIDGLLRDNTLPQIMLAFDRKQPQEGCRITIPHTGAIVIAASAPVGAFYGLNTLKRLRCNDGAYPCGVFEDAPEFAFRGYHFTLGGGMMPNYRRMREIIVQLAEWKYNKLIFEYDDRFPLICHPELVHPNAWSADELKSLIALAESYFIEVIPLLDSLGHVAHYLSHPEYAHLAENPGQIHEMCPQKPETLKLMEEIWEEVLAFHPHSKYAHITGDEVFQVRKFCDKCQPYADAGRLAELFCDYYTKLSRFIIAHGKTPIIWGDMLLKYPQCIDKFPRDVIVCDWHYSAYDAPRWDFNALKYSTNMQTSPERDCLFSAAVDARPDGTFRAYPSINFFCQQGFQVIGAGAGSIGNHHQYTLPRQTLCVQNQQSITVELKANNATGFLHTIWGHSGIECCMYSAFAGAEYAWKVEPKRNEQILSLFNSEYLHCPDAESPIPAADLMYDFILGKIDQPKFVGGKSGNIFTEMVSTNLELVVIDHAMRKLAIERITQTPHTHFRQIPLGKSAADKLVDTLVAEEGPFQLESRKYCLGDLIFTINPQKVLYIGQNTEITIPISGLAAEFWLVAAGHWIIKNHPSLKIRIRYADNTERDLILTGGNDIQDWCGYPSFSRNGTPFIGELAGHDAPANAGLICLRNPCPEKKLYSITFCGVNSPPIGVVILALGCSNAPEPVQPTVDFEVYRQRLEENYKRQCEILSICSIKGDFEKHLHQRIVDSRMDLLKNSFK